MKILVLIILMSNTLYAGYVSDRRARNNDRGNSFANALLYGKSQLDTEIYWGRFFAPIVSEFGLNIAYSRYSYKSKTDAKKNIAISL